MIHQVPIKSLPQEWLWCETWCDDSSKKKAKTIDLVLTLSVCVCVDNRDQIRITGQGIKFINAAVPLNGH